MNSIKYAIRSALTLAMFGTMANAQAFVVVADFDGDGLHDEIVDVFAGTTIQVGVYASQTPVELNTNGGLTGFGLYMSTDGLRITGLSPDAIEINPRWNFVTQQSIVDPVNGVVRVVGNTLIPGGITSEPIHLFDISIDIPTTLNAEFSIDFSDAENASFVSSQGFVYDDLAVFLPSDLTVVPVPDSDGDGLDDLNDNCILAANPNQQDADQDGIGNRCDADLNQDCAVNVVDLGILKQRFFTADPVADLDSSGTVNIVDVGIMKSLFFAQPGPSGLPNLCDGS